MTQTQQTNWLRVLINFLGQVNYHFKSSKYDTEKFKQEKSNWVE